MTPEFEVPSKLLTLVESLTGRPNQPRMILLFGSRARSCVNWHENSDIDLMVIEENIYISYRELRILGSEKVDLMHYTIDKIRSDISSAIRSGDVTLALAILDSRLLFGASAEYNEIVDFVHTSLESGGPVDLLSERIYIQGIIEDFTACQSLEEKLVLSAKLFDAVMGAAMMSIGRGGFTKVHAARVLNAHDPRLLGVLCQSLVNLGKGDFDSIVKVASEFLHSIGGPVHGVVKLGIR